MSRKVFEDQVNFIAQKGAVFIEEIGAWYEDFLGWTETVKEEYNKKKNLQLGNLFVPPTPAACVKRRRPKLSVVQEQEDEGDTHKLCAEKEKAPAVDDDESTAESPDGRPVRRAARKASTRIRGQFRIHKSVSQKAEYDASGDSDDDKPLRPTRASSRRNTANKPNIATTTIKDKEHHKKTSVSQKEESQNCTSEEEEEAKKTRRNKPSGKGISHAEPEDAQETDESTQAEAQKKAGGERSSVKRALVDNELSEVQCEDQKYTHNSTSKKIMSLDGSKKKVVSKSLHKKAVLEASSSEDNEISETNEAQQMNVTRVLSTGQCGSPKDCEANLANQKPELMDVDEEVSKAATGGDEANQAATGGDEANQAATGGDEASQAATGGNEASQAATGGDEVSQAATGGDEASQGDSSVSKPESAGASTESTEETNVDVAGESTDSSSSLQEKGNKPKASILFSPYNNDPVKKRVAAYETLKPVAEKSPRSSPVRMTRTKTRAMAAAAAAKAQQQQKEKQLTIKHARLSLSKARKKLLAKLHKNTSSCEEDSKENSDCGVNKYPVISLKKVDRTPLTASKILMDLNGQSTTKGLSRATPLNTSKPVLNALSTSHINRTASKPGIMVSNVETFITKTSKPVQNTEAKKLEDLKKWKEKEQEAIRKKEEILKLRADQSRKQEEKRLRVLQNHEVQEREKQEAQQRLGREKDEKMKQALHEREARQREEILKRKQQAQQKAAEVERRRQEEIARLAKIKLEEEQALRRREQEEAERAERQRQRLLMEEREREAIAVILREKAEQLAKAAGKEEKKYKKVVVMKQAPKANAGLNSTWVNPGDTGEYNLAEISSDSTDDESQPKKKIATWAQKRFLIQSAKGTSLLPHGGQCVFFQAERLNPDLCKMFKGYNTRYKRTSSQFWKTPPRYSELPKY